MKRIGLLGESPNDTNAIALLLLTKYKGKVEFKPLLNGITGSNLDNKANKFFKRSLRIEYEEYKPDIVIVIRDLDGLSHEKAKRDFRKKYFSSINSCIDKKGIHLLNIFELEALIMADIEKFNVFYNVNHSPSHSDPMMIKEPKEELQAASQNRYTESDSPEIFSKLDIDTLTEKCNYFKAFVKQFNKNIS